MIAPVVREPLVEVPTTLVTPYDAATIPEWFERARQMFSAGKYADAASMFERIARLEPAGLHAAPAIYNAGLCHDALGKVDIALRAYREVVDRFPDAEVGSDARVRSGRIYARREQWPALVESVESLTHQAQLKPLDRVEAFGALALGRVEMGQVEAASSAIARARDIIEEHGLDGGGKLPVGVAEVFFALGEVVRLRGEAIGFVPVPSRFGEVLEERCQLLLDAQDAYAQAMRSYDAHWAAMAGFRVGQLYQRLHEDLMAIAPPMGATTDAKKQLFQGAMRLRYRVLLDKGLQMMNRTLRMAERTGEASSWVVRASEARAELERTVQAEKAALQKLPYAEADLQRALDDLSKKRTP